MDRATSCTKCSPVWLSIGIAVIQFCLFPVGLLARTLLDGVTDTDLIVPTLLNDQAIFPLWVADCLIIAMVAAAMSSMDSVLLVAASVLYKDVVESLHPTAHPLTWTRIGVIGFASTAAFVALDPPGGIVEITINGSAAFTVKRCSVCGCCAISCNAPRPPAAP